MHAQAKEVVMSVFKQAFVLGVHNRISEINHAAFSQACQILVVAAPKSISIVQTTNKD